MESVTTSALLLFIDEGGDNAAGRSEASSDGLTAGAAVGVMAAAVTVVVAAAVVWMWRRQWVLPCATPVAKGELCHSLWTLPSGTVSQDLQTYCKTLFV